MLVPLRVTTARDRSELQVALAQFRGTFLLPAHADITELQRRVGTDLDSERDIWIRAGRVENALSLNSLLHARVEADAGATVDVMGSTDGGTTAQGYKGFGELLLLAMLLEKLGVTRLALPVQLDLQESGLAQLDWQMVSPGLYRHSTGEPAASEATTSSRT